jgi:anti-anti-sigma factor
MKYTVDKKDKFVVLSLLEEKLTSLNAPQLKSELVLVNTEGYRNFILDLSQVVFIDSSGLGAILIGHRLCREVGGTFAITGINPQIRKLIEISQLQTVLNIIPTLDEAMDFVMMEELERDFKEEGE